MRTRPQRAALSIGRIDFIKLDVGGNPECDVRIFWPGNNWPVDERQVIISAEVSQHYATRLIHPGRPPLTCYNRDVLLEFNTKNPQTQGIPCTEHTRTP